MFRRKHRAKTVAMTLPAALWLLVAIFGDASYSLAQDDPKQDSQTEPKATSPFVGFFQDKKVSMTIRQTDGEHTGQIESGGQIFRFKAKVNGSTLKGTFDSTGTEIAFVATLTPTGLVFKSGLQAHKLTRTFDRNQFLGSFAANGLSATIQNKNEKFVCHIKTPADEFNLDAQIVGDQLKGVAVANGARRPFTASVENRVLTLIIGESKYKLLQTASASGIVNSRLVSATLKEEELADMSDVIEQSIVVSPQNRRIAFVRSADGYRRPVIDGVPLKVDDHVTAIMFSNDGQRHALLTRQGPNWRSIVDGKVTKTYEMLGRGPQLFSPDSKRWVISGRTKGQWSLLLDGEEAGAAYDEIQGTTFSPDSKKLAFISRRGKHWFVVTDLKESPPYEGVAFARLLFSPDSERLAFVILRGTNQHVVVNGNESKPHGKVTQLAFSPSSDRIAYVASDRGKQRAIIDGEPSDRYDAINSVAFSADGKHYAFGAQRGRSCAMILDGKGDFETKSFLAVSPPLFSGNGRRLAYVAVKDKKMFVVDNDAIGPQYARVVNLAFDPTGTRLSYLAQDQRGKWRYVVDGHPTSTFDAPVSLVEFGANNRHFAFVCQREGRILVSIDGDFGRSALRPLPGSKVHFESSTQFNIVGRRNSKCIRQVFDIKE